MGVGVAVAPRAVLTAHYLVMGASSCTWGRSTAASGRSARPRSTTRPASPSCISTDRTSAVTPGPDGAASCRRAGLPPDLPGRERAQGGERTRDGGRAVRGLLGVHARSGHHHHVVNPGLAGAPLFDAQGLLVGVVSLGLSAVGRYSLAIPIDLFLERREEMENGAVPRTGPPGPGSASTLRPSTAGSRSRASCPAGPRTRPASRAATCSCRWTERPSGPSVISTRRSGARDRAKPSASRCCATPRSSWSK